jgi:hypothetical protein
VRMRVYVTGASGFIVAALYRYDAPVAEHERVNVEGTRTVASRTSTMFSPVAG